MSTLVIRAPHSPNVRSSDGGWARLAAAFLAALDAFAEIRRQAHEAERRCLFTAW